MASKKHRRQRGKLWQLSQKVVSILAQLRAAGRNIASAWIRADGWIKYQRRYYHPKELILRYQLPV